MKPLRIVIIGSGLGGLASGIRLVSEGYQVTILEKNTLPGGCLRTKEINGFRFNYGAEVITAPFLFDQLFEQAGKNRHDYFDLLPFEPVFQAIFPGEKRFAFFSDPQKTLQWNNLFSQEEERALLSYFQANEEIFNDVFFDYCSKPIQDSQLRSFFPFLPQKLQNQKSSLQVAEAYYKTPELQLVFGFWPLLAGGDPRESGSLFRIIPSIFSHWGASIPVGGMKRVLNSLLVFFLNKVVRFYTILKFSGKSRFFNRTFRVFRLIDGSIYHADIVISDVDALTTFRFLMIPIKTNILQYLRRKTKNPGISVFSYHLGLDCTLKKKFLLPVAILYFRIILMRFFQICFIEKHCLLIPFFS
jgi:phytoene desaturase